MQMGTTAWLMLVTVFCKCAVCMRAVEQGWSLNRYSIDILIRALRLSRTAEAFCNQGIAALPAR